MRFFPEYRNAPVTVDALSLRDWNVTVEENVRLEWGQRGEEEVLFVSPAGPGPARFVMEYSFRLPLQSAGHLHFAGALLL